MSLSRKQNKRLGVLLGVMFRDDVPEPLINEAVADGYIEKNDASIKITPKGLDEKNRLCTLAGLNVKYGFEKKD
tara:strand:- start:1909 stop:2130 length:222 start_codon:yes stop_codon:yes gene_type:complete